MPTTTFAGQPAHPQMIGAPASLLPFGLILDLLSLATKKKVHARAGYYSMLAGCVSGAVAAAVGALDYLSISGYNPTKKTANVHATLNVCIMGIYAVNLLVRRTKPAPVSMWSLVLSLAGNFLLTLSAWYGSKLVYTHGMRVDKVSPVANSREMKLPGDEKIAAAFGRFGS